MAKAKVKTKAKTLGRKRSKIKRHKQSHRKTHKRKPRGTRQRTHRRRTGRKSHVRRNKTHRRTSKKLKGGSDLNVNLLTGEPNKPEKSAFGGLTSTLGRRSPNKYKETGETGAAEPQYQSAPDGLPAPAAAPAPLPAAPLKPAAEDVKRIDPSDGLLYSKEEFIAEYGGTAEWDAVSEAPQASIGGVDQNPGLESIAKHLPPVATPVPALAQPVTPPPAATAGTPAAPPPPAATAGTPAPAPSPVPAPGAGTVPTYGSIASDFGTGFQSLVAADLNKAKEAAIEKAAATKASAKKRADAVAIATMEGAKAAKDGAIWAGKRVAVGTSAATLAPVVVPGVLVGAAAYTAAKLAGSAKSKTEKITMKKALKYMIKWGIIDESYETMMLNYINIMERKLGERFGMAVKPTTLEDRTEFNRLSTAQVPPSSVTQVPPSSVTQVSPSLDLLNLPGQGHN
jgi:hypothetical protein